jgi:DNA-binding response OmpR family regulator
MRDVRNAGRQYEPSSGGEQPRRRGPAVLLVDPSREESQPLAAALSSECDVTVVRSAREAFAEMSVRLPDLVVTELDLPDAAGVEFIARLHAAPATYHVLLLVVTHRRSVRDKIACFQAGADDYIVKPIDPRDFMRHVKLLSRFQRVIGRG